MSEFGAISAGLTIPHNAVYNLPSDGSSYTIEFAFRTLSGSDVLLTKQSRSAGWRFELWSNKFRVRVGDTITHTTAFNANDNLWHFVRFVAYGGTRPTPLYACLFDGQLLDPIDTPSLPNWDTSASITGGPDCKLAEIRLSTLDRGQTTYVSPVFQFEDDYATKGLWHFNEGEGTVGYDSSLTRNNAVVTTSRLEGPLKVSPATVVRDRIWYALDTAMNFRDYVAAANVKTFRYRPNDKVPQERSFDNSPAFSILPDVVPEIMQSTVSFHGLTVPLLIEGWAFTTDPSVVEFMEWLAITSIMGHYVDTLGKLGISRIQGIWSSGPTFAVERIGVSQFLLGFETAIVVDYRAELLPTVS